MQICRLRISAATDCYTPLPHHRTGFDFDVGKRPPARAQGVATLVALVALRGRDRKG
jgi:hypothetical protein